MAQGNWQVFLFSWREHVQRGFAARLRSTFFTFLLLVVVPTILYQLIANRFGFGGLKLDIDFLIVYCLVVLGGRFGVPYVLPLGFALSVASFAMLLLIAVGTIYITDVVLIGQYLSFANYWPWRIILPWLALAMVLIVCLYAGLRRIYFAQSYVWPVILLLLIMTYFGSQQTFRTVTGRNWMTSGFNNIVRMVKATATYEVSVSVPAKGPTMAGDLAGQPLPSHLLSVGVESLGSFVSDKATARIFAPFEAALEGAYSATLTEHTFKGSTLSGEMRELCGLQVEGVPDLKSEPRLRAACLPAQLRAKGYATIGIHGNVRQFYNRQRVYPMLGFGETMFQDDFTRVNGAMATCRDVAFDGVCDRAAAKAAMQFMARHPQALAHIMTLRTHFPLEISDLGDDDCHRWPELEGDRDLCLYANQQAENLRRIGDVISQAKVKPQVIYIYGDHGPPFVTGTLRKNFKPDTVPVLILRLKDVQEAR